MFSLIVLTVRDIFTIWTQSNFFYSRISFLNGIDFAGIWEKAIFIIIVVTICVIVEPIGSRYGIKTTAKYIKKTALNTSVDTGQVE